MRCAMTRRCRWRCGGRDKYGVIGLKYNDESSTHPQQNTAIWVCVLTSSEELV